VRSSAVYFGFAYGSRLSNRFEVCIRNSLQQHIMSSVMEGGGGTRSTIFSESDILDALQATVTLEYVRDSPMFRQSITVFEDSFLQLPVYCSTVLGALGEVQQAMIGLESAQQRLIAALTKQPGHVSRALFTNSSMLPSLSDLTQTLNTMSVCLSAMNKGYEHVRNNIKQNVEPHLQCLAEENLNKERQLHQRFLQKYGVYEQLLGQSLQSRNALSPQQVRYEAKTYIYCQRSPITRLYVQIA
jgi:hypothetical protein